MCKTAVCGVVVFVLVVTSASLASARPPEIYNDTPPSGPSAAAAEDEGVCIYYEDFYEGTGGWSARDLNQQEIYWHHTTYQGMGVMWCGSQGNMYWATPPGYGNVWTQYLTKSFLIPAAPVSLDYSIQYDTEVGWDYVYIQISVDGGLTYVTLEALNGNSGGFVTQSVDLSSYAGADAMIRFYFQSDGQDSDVDGLYDSNGACRLDWVRVTGLPMDDFETGDDGWVASTTPGHPVSYRLEEVPSCTPEAPCDDYCMSWVGYDPATGVFPFPLENETTQIGIESPVIEIPVDATTYLLEHDVYRILPLANCVFYAFDVASPPPEEGGVWRSDGYVYYQGNPPLPYGFARVSRDITGLITPGETRMKIRLYGIDMANIWGGIYCDVEPEHTVSPFFDNVSVRAIGTADPGIDCTSFPTSCVAVAEGSVAGRVTADCPAPDTELLGVTVDAYVLGTGELAGSSVTDANGDYVIELLPADDYTITVVTPLSYDAADDELQVTVGGGAVATADFALTCMNITPSQRGIGFWKHQVGVALGGKGNAHIDGPMLCDYLDLIEMHFNSNAINQVVIYEPPASGECADKLEVAKDLLNLKGSQPMIARARQQLMAVLMNVASASLSLQEVISEDDVGAVVSQAITYCDHVIDDPAGDYETAKDICDWINNGAMVPAGVIPLDTDNIAYSPRPDVPDVPEKFALGQNFPNPFNPSTVIGYDVPADAGMVTLRVYDVAGRLVRTLASGAPEAGRKTVTWDGRDDGGRYVSTGIYFYRLKAEGFAETRKMLLIK